MHHDPRGGTKGDASPTEDLFERHRQERETAAALEQIRGRTDRRSGWHSQQARVKRAS